MSKGILACFTFVAGAAIGVFATKTYFEEKYKAISDEEIESVREAYAKMSSEKENKVVIATEKKNEIKPDITEYSSIIEKNGYINGKKDEEKKEIVNCIIRPDQFGECEYDQVFCTFYKGDEILAYDGNNLPADDVVDFIEDNIGWNGFDEHMGEFEDGLLWLRNDDLGIDYEISLDLGSYEDIHPDTE